MAGSRAPVIPNWMDVYPEALDADRAENDGNAFERLGSTLRRAFPRTLVRKPLERAAGRIRSRAASFSAASDTELSEHVAELRRRLRQDRFSRDVTEEAAALVCEFSYRQLGLRPHLVQLMGSLALLRGYLVEMETGEGKTLTASIATSIAALAGVPVHVFTVNEYLAERDRRIAEPLLNALGLTSSLVTEKMSDDERRAQYDAIVVYGTNKQFVFDYLRDRAAAGPKSHQQMYAAPLVTDAKSRNKPMLRGLHMALIDEADSILVDEARTPLILSRKRDDTNELQLWSDTITITRSLQPGTDFRLDEARQRCTLTDAGKKRAAELAAGRNPLLAARRRREESINQALHALHVVTRGREYVVEDGKVHIVDEFTGRIMADRSWSQGLQQLVEIKEGLPPTSDNETLAQITYQRFFRRYRHLCGMTGTAREIERETWSVYGLPIVTIPPNKPSKRRIEPAAVAANHETKLHQIIARISMLHAEGRPVLIGTRTVSASQQCSEALKSAGIPHSVLNALNDREEAQIVAKAGEAGTITVATNLAGRGTDIKLGPGVREKGGLVVIMTERHESARVDRQLIGRCGRQGDPGLAASYFSLDDELVARSSLRWLAATLKPAVSHGATWGQPLSQLLFWFAQRERERANAEVRRQCLEQDRRLAEILAFSGMLE